MEKQDQSIPVRFSIKPFQHVWETSENYRIPIEHMTDRHIKNSKDMLHRMRNSYHEYLAYRPTGCLKHPQHGICRTCAVQYNNWTEYAIRWQAIFSAELDRRQSPLRNQSRRERLQWTLEELRYRHPLDEILTLPRKSQF